jgi:hypothetical protein
MTCVTIARTAAVGLHGGLHHADHLGFRAHRPVEPRLVALGRPARLEPPIALAQRVDGRRGRLIDIRRHARIGQQRVQRAGMRGQQRLEPQAWRREHVHRAHCGGSGCLECPRCPHPTATA